jgi:antitoxin MazE
MEGFVQVAKWGNSLAVRLPKKLTDSLGLKPGDEIEIVDIARDKLAIQKADVRAAAIERMAVRRWASPADSRFDREAANAR